MFAIIDFESMGPEAKTDRVTEVGLIRVNSDWRVEASYSRLIKGSDYAPLTEEVQAFNGITQEMLDREGVDPRVALEAICGLLAPCEAVVAYNKAFDETIYRAEMARAFPIQGVSHLPHTPPWLCAMTECPWPAKINTHWKPLKYLALDLGLAVDPSQLHRAIHDAELTLRVLKDGRGGPYTIERMQEYAADPWVYIAIDIPHPKRDEGSGRDYAVAQGYRWLKIHKAHPLTFERMWVKRIKGSTLDVFKAEKGPYDRAVVYSDAWSEEKKRDAYGVSTTQES